MVAFANITVSATLSNDTPCLRRRLVILRPLRRAMFVGNYRRFINLDSETLLPDLGELFEVLVLLQGLSQLFS